MLHVNINCKHWQKELKSFIIFTTKLVKKLRQIKKNGFSFITNKEIYYQVTFMLYCHCVVLLKPLEIT